MSAKTTKKKLAIHTNKHACRIIVPDKKFADIAEEKKERKKMSEIGMKFNLKNCTKLAQACFFGYYDSFIEEINKKKVATNNKFNLNLHFETLSSWSLLHFVMFGKKRCISLIKQLSNNYHHMKIAKYLINNGLNIDIQSKWGYTVLYESLMNIPDIELATYLLDNGANPNIANVFGSTVLLSVVMIKNINIIDLLLKYDTDPRIKHTLHQYTAMDLVQTNSDVLRRLTQKVIQLEIGERNKQKQNQMQSLNDVVNKTVINNDNYNNKYDISSKQMGLNDDNGFKELKLDDNVEISNVKGKTNWEEKYMKKSMQKNKHLKNQYKHMKKHLNQNILVKNDDKWYQNNCCICNISRNDKGQLFQCSRCKGKRRYCSVACQRKDWSSHKKICKRLSKKK